MASRLVAPAVRLLLSHGTLLTREPMETDAAPGTTIPSTGGCAGWAADHVGRRADLRGPDRALPRGRGVEPGYIRAKHVPRPQVRLLGPPLRLLSGPHRRALGARRLG
ncbi:hypothetical protein MAPG_11784, partial [Magnaporthiopsis poae ATCC 64411]